MNNKKVVQNIIAIMLLTLINLMTNNATAGESLPITTVRTETADLSSSTQETSHLENVLEFINLDRLHGAIVSIHPQSYGLVWKAVGAEKEIRFNLDTVSRIKLANKPILSHPDEKTIVLLTNDDVLAGDMLSLDDTHLVLITEYSGKLLIKRTMIKKISPPTGISRIIYSGPKDISEWGMNPSGTSAWRCIGEALYASRPFPIGKFLPDIPDKVSFEFNVGWRYKYPSFYFSFCTDNIQHYNGSYTLQISGNSIYLHRYAKGGSSARIGYTNFDKFSSGEKQSASFKLLMNKTEKIFALFVDGQLVQQWTDSAITFAGTGNGIVFWPQTEGGFRVSRIRVSEWDGIIPVSSEAISISNDDLIKFSNGDKVSGKLKKISNDKLLFQTPYATDMEIPLKRISEILFASTTAERSRRNKFDIRLSLGNTAIITFNLIKLENDNIEGESENFGKIMIPLKFCQSIEFNIYKEKTQDEKETSEEFEIFLP